MRLRSFTASSMSDALRLVREELGENAVIVNSETEPNGGVRVSAATDSQTDLPAPRLSIRPQAPPNAAAMRLADPLKEALDPHQLVADILYSHGLSSRTQDLIMTEVEAMPPAPVIDLLSLGLKNVLRFDVRPPLAAIDSPLLLVGPQGAGKTTLAAKILATLHLSNDPIAAMTTDTVRAGGIGQLAAITNLLPCPLIEIEDAFALTEGLAAYRDRKCVVIDSAGLNPYEDRDMKAAAEWVCAASEARPTLILPAGLDVRETSWIASGFGRAGAQAIMMTRVDATRRLGGVISAAIETGLQLCGMTVSAKLTDPPRALTPRMLANLLVLKSDIELAEDELASEMSDNGSEDMAEMPQDSPSSLGQKSSFTNPDETLVKPESHPQTLHPQDQLQTSDHPNFGYNQIAATVSDQQVSSNDAYSKGLRP